MNPTIELPINELKTALTGLGKVISKRTSLPVLEHLRVTRSREGTVTFQATDLDATVLYQAEAPNTGPACDFLVPFEPLNKLVKGAKESLIIVAESKDKVRLRSFIGGHPLEQSFETPALNEYPATPVVTGKPMPVDQMFRDSLREALDCCSDESSRFVLHHACLDTRNEEGHYIAASNGRHLYCANSFAFDLKVPVLVPDRDFLRWNKFMETGTGQLSVKPQSKNEGSWMQLQSGPWTFLTKTCDEEFPNWKQVVPAPNSRRTVIQFHRDAVATLLAGVPQLPGNDDSNRPVKVEITGNGVLVQAKARDAQEWTRLAVDGATINGKPVSISLNRDYLLKALRFGLHNVEIEDALSPLVFSEGGRRLVVMPLRPDDNTVKSTASAQQPTPTNNPPVSETAPPAQPKATSTMPKATETQPAETATAESSPVKAVAQHIENIRETLKGVLKEFSQVLDDLKQLEKDKKASDKEVESVREKLREIQSVRI